MAARQCKEQRRRDRADFRRTRESQSILLFLLLLQSSMLGTRAARTSPQRELRCGIGHSTGEPVSINIHFSVACPTLSSCIVHVRISAPNGNTIDLHGITAAEAIYIVKTMLTEEPASGCTLSLFYTVPHFDRIPFSQTSEDHYRTWQTFHQSDRRPRSRCTSRSRGRRMERGQVGRRPRRPRSHCTLTRQSANIYTTIDLTTISHLTADNTTNCHY